MPKRLRPTAPMASAAILVGDPGRALMLAQEVLEQPKMSNHARGLWGYTGSRPGGRSLTVQATGMGGPSAAVVLADLAKLGVKTVVRVGTCAALAGAARLGELLVISGALAEGGSAAAFGVEVGGLIEPHAELRRRLGEELGAEAREGRVASFDALPAPSPAPAGWEAADLQTVAVFGRAAELDMAAAAVLVVREELGGGDPISDDEEQDAAKVAGRAAARVL